MAIANCRVHRTSGKKLVPVFANIYTLGNNRTLREMPMFHAVRPPQSFALLTAH
jgi:hypothetical protein